jgi:squalene-hopene/tetraprenyl-beta-curcumene cyclase
MKCCNHSIVVPIALLLGLGSGASAQEVKQEIKLLINSADEPVAKKMSLAKTAEFLDHQSLAWTQVRKCGTCHTNLPYLVSRGQLGGDLTALKEVRGFFEKRIANWDSGKKEDMPKRDSEVVTTAATLALQDGLTTGKLHPLTRKALDRMWTLQKPNGAWEWPKCGWPPLEHDDYYGVVYVTVAVGHAPDNYAQTEQAKEGLEILRRYFNYKTNPPPSLHHKAMLLWASQKVSGIMSEKLQQSTIQELRTLQKGDGGWSLPTLGDWVGFDERPNDRSAPSDGYATGFVIFILRQAGVPASDNAIQKGIAWLQNNQRESGRWFTRSINTDRYHFITHAGTAYAVLALKACE